jgi:heat-inducible transcriptional repressor
LNDRERRILCLLVGEYIERGEPVSSLWLATRTGLGLSSATVRNVLSSLEERGYVRQPHTSAGRIPTDLGYRCYVDFLLQGRRPSRVTRDVEARLRQAASVDAVLSDASHELSRVCHHLGFALAPLEDGQTLQKIDFVALGRGKVLVVVVAESGQVSHKVVDLGEPI